MSGKRLWIVGPWVILALMAAVSLPAQNVPPITGTKESCGGKPCGSSGGGTRTAPRPSPADLERERAQAKEFTRQQKTREAKEFTRAGLSLARQGNHESALPKFRESARLLSPYEAGLFNDSVEALLNVRYYIAVSEAHVAAANGDLDLAVSKLDRLCGFLGACNSDDNQFYEDLKRRRDEKVFASRHRSSADALLDSVLEDVARKDSVQSRGGSAARILDSVGDSIQNAPQPPSAEPCTGPDAAICILNVAAHNSAAAKERPVLTEESRRQIPTVVKPPYGKAEAGPGPVAGEEGSKSQAGCWADGTGNCQQPTTKAPEVRIGAGITPRGTPIPKGLAPNPAFQSLLRQSADISRKIEDIDQRLNRIRQQRESGAGDRNALDKERYDLIDQESNLRSQQRIVDNKVEEKVKNFLVGFDEDKPEGQTDPQPKKPGAGADKSELPRKP